MSNSIHFIINMLLIVSIFIKLFGGTLKGQLIHTFYKKKITKPSNYFRFTTLVWEYTYMTLRYMYILSNREFFNICFS